ATGKQLVLAIEEPESHLHPNAIHQLKAVLTEIARKHQVIMTTHCPLFIDRTSIKSNIVVFNRKAAPAKDVRQIRDVLGVRASDNLQHAELVLLVEGEDDRKSVRAILRELSRTLASALAQGSLGIESLHGGSNLCYKLSQVREALCQSHCFVDNDACAVDAYKKAINEGLMTLADVTLTVCDGMKESELEDVYDENLYASMLFNKFGVSTASPKFKGNEKWSDRAQAAFRHQGKPWNDQIKAAVKLAISELVDANPSSALNGHKRNSLDALVTALEGKLLTIAAGKR